MEHRLRAILDSVFGFVGLCALDGTLLEVNKASLDVLKLRRDEVVGVLFWDTFPFSYGPEVQAQTRAALERTAAGETVRYDVPIRAKDGTWIVVDVMFAPLCNEDESIEHILAFGVDITERKVAEQTLQKSEERYRAIVEDQADLVIRWNAVARVTFANGAACRFWRRPLDEIVGKSLLRRILAEDLPAFYAHLSALTPERPVTSFEHRVDVGGDVRWIDWTTRAIYDSAGDLVEYQSVGRDTTERRRIEEALKLTQFSVDRTSDSVYWVSAEAEILNVNRAACSSLGYQREELIGKKITDIDPNFDADAWPGRWSDLEQQQALSFESTQRRKDGTIINTQVTANIIEYEGRKLSCAIVRDITERKRAEHTLQMMQFSVDRAAEAVLWIAPSGRILYSNSAAGALLGYGRNQLLERCISDFDTQLPAEAWTPHWQKVQQSGSLLYESNYRSRAGRVIPVEITSNYACFGEQEFNVVFCRDVTERKNAELTLRRSEEQFSTLFYSAPVAIVLADQSSLRFVEVNEAFLKLFECNRAEAVGATALELNMWPSPADRTRLLQMRELQGSIHDMDIVLTTKSGAPRDILLSVEPVQIGGRAHLLAMCIDVTESRRLSEQATLLRNELTHASRVRNLGELASGLAHELNQPLTSLCLYANLALELARSSPPDEMLTCLERISDLAMRAGAIVRTTRTYAGSQTPKRAQRDINELIRDVLIMLDGEFRSRSLSLTSDLRDDLPTVHVDGVQIQQVLVNLVRNALEAMENMSAQPGALSVVSELDEDGVRVRVSDSGCGVDAAIAADLFHPFQTTKPNGIGLGLRISHNIITAHDGKLGFYRNDGGGTTFYFVLPLSRP